MNHAAKANQATINLIRNESLPDDSLVEDLIADAPDDKHSLLDELQSLKKMLDASQPPTPGRARGIPESLDLAILDDVIPLTVADRVTSSNLLDLDLIFEDESIDRGHAETQRPDARAETGNAPEPHPQQLRLLIQEIVDELVPVVEDRLRQRLMSMSADAILELADAILDS